MSRWQVDFTTLSPFDGFKRTWAVGVLEKYVQCLRHKGHAAPLARLLLVEKTLDQPVAIIEGWSRPDKDDCYVFIGSPSLDYRSLTIETDAPPNSLFLVFILPDGTIDHWNWRHKAPGSAVLPEDMKGQMVWEKTRKS